MLQELLNQMASPAKEFRSSPFWAWNCELKGDRLREEIRAMKEAGMGGFFMHSRYGLKTPYLGEEWFKVTAECIDEAKKLDMEAWLYDEDRWPSGVAGGLLKLAPDQELHGINFAELDSPDYTGTGKKYFFAVQYEGEIPVSYRALQAGDALRSGEKFARIEVIVQPPSDGNNGIPYIDTMNAEAVKLFIDATHEKYAERFPDELGKTVPGIFSDEPMYRYFTCSEIWSPKLPAYFLKRNGYSIEEKLPELFYELNGCQDSKVRLDFFNTATEMFTTAFGKQIGDWCARHHMIYTGHVLGEEDLFSQMLCVGAAMRYYQYMQLPGMDVLTECWNIFDAPKQVASVAHQQGKPRRLSELYGCTNWEFPFEGHKAIGDWHAALGINLRCQHLFWASMEGQSKRDYPASISPHSPWFRNYRTVEDYFGRIFAALAAGDEVRDVLVIHPMESLWFHRPYIRYEKEPYINMEGYFLVSGKEKWREQNVLSGIRKELLKNHIDFDYGDEEILSKLGKMEGRSLTVGKAVYKAVVIPELRTIRATTLKLVADFAAAGGTVLYHGEPPKYVDGLASKEAEKAYRNFQRVALDETASTLSPLCRRVSIAQNGREIEPALFNLHEAADCQVMFVCSTSMNYEEDEHRNTRIADRKLEFPEAVIRWQLPEAWQIYEIEPATGVIRPVASEYEGGVRTFASPFCRLGSHLYVACEKNIATAPALPPPFAPARTTPLSKPWRYTLEEQNLLVFDRFEYAVNGGAWQEKTYCLTLDDRLHKELGIKERRAGGFQPWFMKVHPLPLASLALKLRMTFTSEIDMGECFFALEHPEVWQITVNGQKLEKEDAGYWCDPAIRKLRVPANLLHKGENIIEMAGDYTTRDGALEAVYLFGDFGVTPQEAVTAAPAALPVGDVTKNGFPHYAGNFTLEQEFDYAGGRLLLSLGEKVGGVAAEVRVNGSGPVMLAWPPYETEITELVKPGKNVLAIRILGHRRNALGQFYSGSKENHFNGPRFFLMENTKERCLVPVGLLTPPELRFE